MDKLSQEELLEYGNRFEISGVLFADAKEGHLIAFPDATFPLPTHNTQLSHEGWKELLFQLDTLGIIGLDKTVLRKSQRNIEQNVSWNVYRRDGYTCQYCNNSHVPLTVDHIVLWELMGDSVEGNLISACKKCNKTRASMSFEDWLKDAYLTRVMQGFGTQITIDAQLTKLKAMGIDALKLPLRKTQRSR